MPGVWVRNSFANFKLKKKQWADFAVKLLPFYKSVLSCTSRAWLTLSSPKPAECPTSPFMSSARGPGMRESIRAGMTLWGRLRPRRKTFSRIPCPCTLAEPSDRWLTLLLSCVWQRDARERVLRTQVTVVSCGNCMGAFQIKTPVSCLTSSLAGAFAESSERGANVFAFTMEFNPSKDFHCTSIFSKSSTCTSATSNRPVWLHCRSPSAGTLPDQHCSPDTPAATTEDVMKAKAYKSCKVKFVWEPHRFNLAFRSYFVLSITSAVLLHWRQRTAESCWAK